MTLQDWTIEHRFSVNEDWHRWHSTYTEESVLTMLVSMIENTHYEYRAVNIHTGEIIYGLILQHA